MKIRQPAKAPKISLGTQIQELAVEVQRRRNPRTGEMGGHLRKEVGPRHDFITLLRHPKFSSLDADDVNRLREIAKRLDSVSESRPRFFQDELETALRKARRRER